MEIVCADLSYQINDKQRAISEAHHTLVPIRMHDMWSPAMRRCRARRSQASWMNAVELPRLSEQAVYIAVSTIGYLDDDSALDRILEEASEESPERRRGLRRSPLGLLAEQCPRSIDS